MTKKPLKIVIPGGSGQVGMLLGRALLASGHEVTVLSRAASDSIRSVHWDGSTLGEWAKEIDGADVIINLAGRSVNCRYTKENLEEMLRSRVDSTRIIGQAIAKAKRPPSLWLQMSTATIYAHTFGPANDEKMGILGGSEPEVPGYWGFSIEIAKAWERELANASTPQTRKVALRSAMVMSPDRGGIFSVLLRLARLGLGGSLAGGQQFVSWIHGQDFARVIEFLIEHEEIVGPVNLASPNPLPQKDFMRAIRRAARIPIGLPAAKWMLELGAVFMRTDTELLLKSRRVIPSVLLDAGFEFRFSKWEDAAADLVPGDR